MILYAKKEDSNAIKELFNECFPEDLAFNEWFFENAFDYKNTIVYKAENKIVAMLQALPYRLFDLGNVSYIYGACTKKEYRNRGLMNELINFSFEEDKKNNKLASILIPASESLFDFYGRFGYEKSFYISEKTENSFLLPTSLSLEEINQSSTNINKLVDIYVNNLKNSLFVERDYSYFSQQIKMFNDLGSKAYALKDNDNIVGYCFLFKEDIPFVQEIMTIDDDKYLKPFKALLFKATQKEKIKFIKNGSTSPLGCIKWHKKVDIPKTDGYMNLMFN